MSTDPGEIGRLGPYRLLKVVGGGDSDVVFRAEGPHGNGPLAVKMLRPALAQQSAIRERFLQEARRAATVAHHRLVPIYDVGEENGVPFLAMPLLTGESLEARLGRDGRLSTGEVLSLGRQTAEGLAAAHEQGIIHGDLRPANIFLSPLASGTTAVTLLGLGLAASVQADPAYQAPEQPSGQPLDRRCDLFSLGCVLYRLCTGRAPFHGTDAEAVLAAVALEKPRPPREVDADVPAGVSELIMKLLAKKPAERPATAHAVVIALRDLGAPEPPDASPPSSTGRRWLWTAAILLLLAGGGWLVTRLLLST